MNILRRHKGSTFVLAIVCLGILILMISFLVINFHQLIGTQKETQTAIDAAALQAAIDVSRVVVTKSDGTYFGTVGLVDQPATNPSQRPVIGINTLMATIRLDAVIADQLGNGAMEVAAAQDLAQAQSDSAKLRKKILSALYPKYDKDNVKDRDGNKIDVLRDVHKIFDTNAVNMSQGKRIGDLKITAGQFSTTEASSNMPVPEGDSRAKAHGTDTSSKFYKAYLPIDTNIIDPSKAQHNLRFMFIALADNPALVGNDNFQAYDPQDTNPALYLAPSIVQVSGKQEIKSAANMVGPNKEETDRQKQYMTSELTVVATAECGAPRQSFASGSLVIGFPQTTPPSDPDGVNTSSAKSLMNSSQINLTGSPNISNPTANLGSASQYAGWNRRSTGAYYQMQGSTNSLAAKSYRSRTTDDPGVVLSFLVYDWLRHAYLRPNVDKVVAALSTSFDQTPKTALLRSTQPIVLNDSLVAATYAKTDELNPVTFGLYDIPLDGQGDPRSLANFATSPDGYRRQLANVFGYVQADATLPETSLVVSIKDNGQVTTTNGQPVANLVEFFQAVKDTNSVSIASYTAAKTVAKQKLKEFDDAQKSIDESNKRVKEGKASTSDLQASITKQEGIRAASLEKLIRAINVMKNSYASTQLSLGMVNDRKTISALGVKKLANNNYAILGGTFFPATKAATVEQILGDDPISTGQRDNRSVNDWAAPLDEKGQCKLVFFQAAGHAVGNASPENRQWMTPALAASTIRTDQIEYVYVVQGDASTDSQSGNTVVSATTLTGYGSDVLDNQYVYQNTASLVTSVPNSPCLAWNCMARDNGALDSNAGYYNDQGKGSNGTYSIAGGSYPLIAEWTLRCPAPTTCADIPPLCQPGTFGQIGGTNAAYAPVKVTVDQAGNMEYYYGNQKMYFVPKDGPGGMAGDWAAIAANNWQKSTIDLFIKNQTSGVYGISKDAADYIKSRGGNVFQDAYGGWHGDMSKFSPYTNISQLDAKTQKTITDALGNKQSATFAAFGFGDIWEALNFQIYFYTEEISKQTQNTCARMYQWSS